MIGTPFVLRRPSQVTTPYVFASPHSGCDYSNAFQRKSILDLTTLRSSEDAFVDKIFDNVITMGAPFLAASAPRSYVDLNRASEELDSGVVEGVRNTAHNPRIVSGLGVIPRVVSNGRSIYHGKISNAEAKERLNDVWYPYHRKLQELLDAARGMFGRAILIDCHSMPHEAVDPGDCKGNVAPQIVLGDRFGASADTSMVDRIQLAFEREGFRVARNAPFAGAYITQNYGRPLRHQHVVQVEIDRSLYMNEATLALKPEFSSVRRSLLSAMKTIIDNDRMHHAVAAE